jgi:hypothetical protein
MSILIGGCAGTRYGCCSDGKTSKRDASGSNCPGTLPPPPSKRESGQILSGNVTIKKVSSDDYTHKITFSKKKISTVFTYQAWSDSSAELNNNCIVKEVKATSWVKRNFVNDDATTTPNPDCICTQDYNPVICENGKIYSNDCYAKCAGQTNCAPSSDVVPVTLTAVMELDDCPFHKCAPCRHVFVIKRALVNKCGQVVFYVSSEDIALSPNPSKELKLIKTIPAGSFHKARFNIS